MMNYRDQSFCTDQKECATQDCIRRLTDKDHAYLKANTWMPVSYISFKSVCDMFAEVSR